MTLNHIIKGAFLQHGAMEPVILATKLHKEEKTENRRRMTDDSLNNL
jgi:hypothetical protein